MTYGSLFSWCGGMDIGLDRAGLECRWQVEIDKTARSVLARHWPDVPKFEDVCEVGKRELCKVDVIAGGWPCQDLSVAGQRKGLQHGERSGLFYELARIAAELRPRYLVWENVPGLLSSDDGRDFARVIRHLGECGYRGCWRVCDAQYFGVPQQRRRVFGVFSFGDFTTERCAEILALTQGLQRNPAESRKKRPGVTGAITQSYRSGGIDDNDAQAGHLVYSETGAGHTSFQEAERIGALRQGGAGAAYANLVYGCNDTRGERSVAGALTTKATRQDFETENFVLAFTCKDHAQDAGEVSPTLRAMGHSGSHANAGGQVAVYALSPDASPKGRDGVAYSIQSRAGRGHGHGQAVCVTGDTTHALTALGADASEDGTGRDRGIDNPTATETIRADSHGAIPMAFVQNQRNEVRAMEGPIGSLQAEPGMKQQTYLNVGTVLRRLTPIECERLMSWPDDFTKYRADGTVIADGPRYKMIGNGVVANCAEWIGRRLVSNLSHNPAV